MSSGQSSEAKAGPARFLVIALFFLPSHCVFLEVPSQAQYVSPETHSTFPAAFNSASLAPATPFQSPEVCNVRDKNVCAWAEGERNKHHMTPEMGAAKVFVMA